MYNKYYQVVTTPCISKDFHSHPKPMIETGNIAVIGRSGHAVQNTLEKGV